MHPGRACDLCGHAEFETISHRDRRARPLETVVCKRCGLVSHAVVPTDSELAAYYAHQYRREYHGEYTPSAHRVVREWRRGKALVEQLSPDLSTTARVFEVGAGIGGTVMNFVLAGFDASGIEPGEGFRRFAVEKLHARVSDNLLDNMPALKHFDCVLLVHVLEHLPSPTLALKRVRNLLRPRGCVYIEVPNFAGPHAAPGKQFHPAHIYNFTSATLRMLASKTGFVVKRAYTAPFDRNVGMMLEASDSAYLRVEPQSYAQTKAALRRYNTLTYHGRPSYVLERLGTISAHFSDRWHAGQKLADILAQCDRHAAAPRETVPLRRAA